MRKIQSLTQIFFLLMICSLSYSDYAANVGTITYTEGVVDVSHKGEEPSPLIEKDTVCVGDRIRTKTYSKAEITFDDKSILRLAPGTCIIIDEYIVEKNRRKQANIKLTRGKAQAIVSRTGVPETFVISTPNAAGKVKGSNIFVSYQAGKTGVLVKEGLMSLSNISLPEEIAEVKGGDYSAVSFSNIPTQPRPYFNAEIALHQKDVERAVIKKSMRHEKAIQMTGVVTALTGEARIYKKGTDDWREAKLNELIAEGDKLQTGESGSVEIRLSNGNIILLQNNTEFAITSLKYDPETREYENIFESGKGKIKAIVERHGEKSKFQVRTPTAVCGVRGTVMYLNIQSNLTQSFYEGGSGIVTSVLTGKAQVLDAGQNTIIDAAGEIAPPVYTLNEQKISMEGSWNKEQVIGGYSAPIGPAAPEKNIPMALFNPQMQQDPDKAKIEGMDKPFDKLIPFRDVFPPTDSSSTPGVPVIYAGPPLPLKIPSSSPWIIGPGRAVMDILENGTWRGIIDQGNFNAPPAAPWTITYENMYNDEITITGSTVWSGGKWHGDVNGVVRGTPIDKTLTGVADGPYSGVSSGVFSADMTGTWMDQ